jgi:hypothetical protein
MFAFSRVRRVGLLLAVAVVVGLGAASGARPVLAQASYGEADYIGSWHLMFQGKAFATLSIEKHGGQLGGSLTGASIEMDDNGKLTNAVATNGPTSALHAVIENGVMHVSEKDGTTRSNGR